MDLSHLQEWIGKRETRSDLITAAPMACLSATLDRDDPSPALDDEIPPLWHWLWFVPVHRQSELAPDGHVKLGNFLPPVPLPRRMWGGNRLEFRHPLRVGETVQRTSQIQDVRSKEGRTGTWVLVTVRHEIANSLGVALIEEHDIVYRERATPGQVGAAPEPAPTDHLWERTVFPDDVLLFRYSALTFNGHRIHYDRRYATEVEGYPGLVVHGPLIATLLADLLRRNLPGIAVSRFSCRAVSPLFDGAPFQVCGKLESDRRTAHLWAKNAAGSLAMTATAQLH